MTHHRFIIIITIKHQQAIKEKKEYEEEKNYSNNGGDHDGSGAFSLLTFKCQARGKIRYCKG
jgi:hypothetical protein